MNTSTEHSEQTQREAENPAFTPGACSVIRNSDRTLVIEARGGPGGAVAYPARINGDPDDPVYGTIAWGYANLFASAPTLYAEIQRAIDELDPEMRREDIVALRERLIFALAKALPAPAAAKEGE